MTKTSKKSQHKNKTSSDAFARAPAKAVLAAVAVRREAYWRVLDEMVKAANGAGDDIADAREKRLAAGTIEIADPHDGRQKIKRNIRAHALDLAFSKGQLSHEEWAAGTRLRDIWELSQISPMRSLDLERVLSSLPKPGTRCVKVRGKGQTASERLRDEKRERAQRWRPMAAKMRTRWADINPSVLDAQHELGRLRRKVEGEARSNSGASAFDIAIAFAAEGRTLAALIKAGKLGRNRKTMAVQMHEALGVLAVHFGYRNDRPEHPRRVKPLRVEEVVS